MQCFTETLSDCCGEWNRYIHLYSSWLRFLTVSCHSDICYRKYVLWFFVHFLAADIGFLALGLVTFFIWPVLNIDVVFMSILGRLVTSWRLLERFTDDMRENSRVYSMTMLYNLNIRQTINSGPNTSKSNNKSSGPDQGGIRKSNQPQTSVSHS